jgi:Fe-S oxidoreductase
VFIENVPRLIDMRRYQVQVEASFPPEIQRVFEGMERQGNPWGVGQDRRDEWAEDLSLPIWDGPGKYEYLFFVGCAGSYDDRQKKVSRALVRILKEAKVSFAILGKQEMCNGDSARRLGNEYLYQTLAKTNVETFNGLGVKAVITQCPHCFNTIKNEYPAFGGEYRVLNHTELISELIRDKRIKLSRVKDATLTYHDPCYLGRHPGVERGRDAAEPPPVVLLRRGGRAHVDGGAHRHAHQPEPVERGRAHARARQGPVRSLPFRDRQGPAGQGGRVQGSGRGDSGRRLPVLQHDAA